MCNQTCIILWDLLCLSLTDKDAAAEFLFPLLTGLGGFLRNGIITEP